MPIVINELVIKATVKEPRPKDDLPQLAKQQPPPALQDLVEICVAEVIRIMKQEMER